MIKVENVTKAYGSIQALRGISFEVDKGEIVGLLGPNGAGKSTTIKILTGYMHPDEGNVLINGQDVLTQSQEAQAEIGYLSENTPLYPNLSVQAYLKLMADIRSIPRIKQQALLSEAIYATGLVEYRTRQISQLSKGLRQRVGLAQAILHKPKLLILDEPTVGLDPAQIIEIRNLISRLAQNSTILFSSHILSEVEALCDRVIIIINGQIKTDARLDELSTTTNTILVLQQPHEVNEALTELASVKAIEAYKTREGYPAYRIMSDTDIAPQIFEIAKQRDWPLRELRRDILTLETVFNRTVTTV